jgi:anti-sigma regulatory factor (Ser/Thr protein kinase)
MAKRKPGPGECAVPTHWDGPWESDVTLAERDTPTALTTIVPLRDGPWPGQRFHVPANLAYGTAVRRQIQGVATDHFLSPADTADLVLAVSEAFNNAVRHGTSGAEDSIEFRLQFEDGKAGIELRYLGEPFNAGTPDLPPPTAASGRGRYIMSMLLDQIDYRFDNPWTILRLVKNFRIHDTPRNDAPAR